MTLLIADTGEWIAATPERVVRVLGRRPQTVSRSMPEQASMPPAPQQLAGKFYRPGLLKAILSGKRPK